MLVVGLILLVVISLMGAVAYGVATQQERISGNSRDKLRAFEAAETALRDCEVLLRAAAAPVMTGASGLYVAPTAPAQPFYERVNWEAPAEVRVLAAPTIDGVARQPACIVEELETVLVPSVGGALSARQQLVPETFYRITAQGVGARRETIAMVQSTYRRR